MEIKGVRSNSKDMYSLEERVEKIRNCYEELEKDPTTVGQACIDGRPPEEDPEDLRPMIPGAALTFAVTEWLIDPNKRNYQNPAEAFDAAFLNLIQTNIAIAVHNDQHSQHHDHEEVIDKLLSGCGFADRIRDILNVLSQKSDDIWTSLKALDPELEEKTVVWNRMLEKLKTKEKDFNNVPRGKDFTGMAKAQGAVEITLEGDHNEMVAMLNNKMNTSLNTRKTNREGIPAFNYDRWYLLTVLEKLGWQKEKIEEADLLMLGLYAVTKNVLVDQKREQKGEKPLPAFVNN